MRERNDGLIEELAEQRSLVRGLAVASEAVTVGATANALIQNGEPISVSLGFIGWAVAAGAVANSWEISANIRKLTRKTR